MHNRLETQVNFEFNTAEEPSPKNCFQLDIAKTKEYVERPLVLGKDDPVPRSSPEQNQLRYWKKSLILVKNALIQIGKVDVRIPRFEMFQNVAEGMISDLQERCDRSDRLMERITSKPLSTNNGPRVVGDQVFYPISQVPLPKTVEKAVTTDHVTDVDNSEPKLKKHSDLTADRAIRFLIEVLPDFSLDKLDNKKEAKLVDLLDFLTPLKRESIRIRIEQMQTKSPSAARADWDIVRKYASLAGKRLPLTDPESD